MSTFIADTNQQHRPGRNGYDDYDVGIASPELPCGAAWLASCLFELGVPLWKPWGIDDRASWQHIGGRRWRYHHPGNSWSRLVPGLIDGRSMRFLPRPVPQFTHAWPGQLPLPPRLILFVRDPRDALYSHWQRQRRLGVDCGDSASEFLIRPTSGIQLPPRVWLGLFLAAWKVAATSRPTLIVRFEEAKAGPVETLSKVLSFLELRTSTRSIVRAVGASTHARTVEAENNLLQQGIVNSGILGPGIPFAHRQHAVEERVALDARLARIAKWYGYEDTVADSTEDHRDASTHLLKALQPSSAYPEFFERCLRAAALE